MYNGQYLRAIFSKAHHFQWTIPKKGEYQQRSASNRAWALGIERYQSEWSMTMQI